MISLSVFIKQCSSSCLLIGCKGVEFFVGRWFMDGFILALVNSVVFLFLFSWPQIFTEFLHLFLLDFFGAFRQLVSSVDWKLIQTISFFLFFNYFSDNLNELIMVRPVIGQELWVYKNIVDIYFKGPYSWKRNFLACILIYVGIIVHF